MSGLIRTYWKPFLAVVFWGFSFIATKIILDELEPLVLIEMRLFFAIILLTFVAIYTGRSFRVSRKNLTGIFILALIACFHLWIQVTGMQFTTASNTGWIIGITPVFMAILGVFFFREYITILRGAGILIAFIGLLLLIGNGNIASIDLLKNKGDFLVLGSAFTWSVYSAVNKKISLRYSSLMTILFLFIIMFMVLLPFTLMKETVAIIPSLSVKSWVSVLFLGFFCSGIAYVLWAQSLREMESARAGAFLYFEPFVTVFAAWLLLAENVTLLMMLSGVIITIGVIMVNMSRGVVKRLFRRLIK